MVARFWRRLYRDVAATLPIIIVLFSPSEKWLLLSSKASSATFKSVIASEGLPAYTLSV
ncbi:hypothetical protein QE197_03015 [Arsenophonus nasoniae]|uniref:Uncharacterized protein n=2 Tax=Arsenophonus nasoniae TaxID=638 RepID=D2U2Y9_9GAMM|nr:hypothetical protein [Arsenophonus nasoniae]WGM06415.1 hypothetical protein QE258_03455 [Arsenophonus nasoniae]WGM11350.1 hypothetical protein QE197_03015 [Arsenophonus nasoniae]WGM16050.1 hypothetical protein QE193_02990 [Arsenophonus nasoniae]CBA75543.1 hypothetical protein ARN_29780 [Arsenophonus nasoniae]